MIRGLALVVATAACNQWIDLPEPARGACDPAAEFVELAPVAGLPLERGDFGAWLSPDERLVVFSRQTTDDAATPRERHGDLYLARRADRGAAFGPAEPLRELNTEADELSVSLTRDLQTIYFDRMVTDPPDANGDRRIRYQLMSAQRAAEDAPFTAPLPLTLTRPDRSDYEPFVVASALYFSAAETGRLSGLFVAHGGGVAFGPPDLLASLQTRTYVASYEHPVVTADQREIYFSVPPATDTTARELWHATRTDPLAAFDPPARVTSLAAGSKDRPAAISDDNCRLYFITDRAGAGPQLWVAARRD